MPPYDNVERRYCHTDATRDEGRAIVAQVLDLPDPLPDEVHFDLSFFSGGIGVLDRLAITLPADTTVWSRVVNSQQGRTLEQVIADQNWADNLSWLFNFEAGKALSRPAAIQFINQERRDFQTACTESSRILFGNNSDVNVWVAIWGNDSRLNYLGYSQG